MREGGYKNKIDRIQCCQQSVLCSSMQYSHRSTCQLKYTTAFRNYIHKAFWMAIYLVTFNLIQSNVIYGPYSQTNAINPPHTVYNSHQTWFSLDFILLRLILGTITVFIIQYNKFIVILKDAFSYGQRQVDLQCIARLLNRSP